MAWNDAPPTKKELSSTSEMSWASAPPTAEELGQSSSKIKPSELESATRGFVQGASLGFRDEAAGAMKSPSGALKEIANKFGAEFSDADIEDYKKERDASRELDRQAKEANENSYLAGEIGGSLASSFAPGMGALNAVKGIKGAAAVGAGIGGAQALGSSSAENVGDLAQDVGTGAVLGGFLGAGTKAISPYLSRGVDKAKEAFQRQTAKLSQSQSAKAAAQARAKSSATISGGDLSVEQGGKLFDYKAPQSLDELRAWKPQQNSGELLGKTRLQEIEGIVPDLKTKPLKYHYDMMENPKSMKELKLQFENLPTKDAQKIAAYNQQIVDESGEKIKDTVRSISGSDSKSLMDSGDDFIGRVKEIYNEEKNLLKPAFQELQKNSRKLNQAETMDLAQAIGQNSKIGNLMQIDEQTGRLALAKNTPRTGISDAEHSVLSRVIDDMNDGMTFKEIQDTRDFLRKAIDNTNPSATAEISNIRSILLGQLEEMAQKEGPSVGEVFKKYAVNERARENVEKIIGGKIESIDAMFSANPERVVKKIFSNPNYAKVVEGYVGPEKLKEMAQAYVENGISKAYDSANGFKPNVVRTWLKSNQSFVNNYLDKSVAQKINALADYGHYGKKFLQEVNPSGTAASIKEMVEPRGFLQKVSQKGILGAVQSEAASIANSAVNQRQASRFVNESLGGKNKTAIKDYIRSKFKNINENIPLAIQRALTSQASSFSGASSRAENKKKDNKSPSVKGSDKWAIDGYLKIQNIDQSFQDPKLVEKIFSDKKGKELLIQASDLKPGTKAMDKILEKIKQVYEKGNG